MNLAVILGVCWLCLGSPQSATPTQPQASPSQSAEPAQAAPAPPSQPPTPDQAKPSASSPAKRRHHKKAIPNCSNSPAAPDDPTKPADTNTASLPPCPPPPKKVVRNGGSKEPSIQLVGGADAEPAVHQRSTEELTADTEANLKKLAGRQLSSSQHDTVTQIQQFMDQAKTAIAAGDIERGHNLALKAHLLSDELLKP